MGSQFFQVCLTTIIRFACKYMDVYVYAVVVPVVHNNNHFLLVFNPVTSVWDLYIISVIVLYVYVKVELKVWINSINNINTFESESRGIMRRWWYEL